MLAPLSVEAGKPVCFSGYAEDYGKQIKEVQFSLDEGRHWTSYDVSDSTPDLWVYWTFSYTPLEPGSYRLYVRSVNEEGKPSPEADVIELMAT
ncbi:MAG: hypothetical protein LBG81_08350 [Coriobacteriaceae bacterium]|nr:hypothetical protein [Coriobacteriaceae bacterium]